MRTAPQVVIRTKVLEISCEVSGPRDGRPVILLHGWPDDVRTWDGILPSLHAAEWRTIVPYLRGFGETRFRDVSIMRTGQLSAIGQDVMDLANAMDLSEFAVVGHDWGARAAYITASQLPQRVSHCVALSVGYGTNDPKQKLNLKQVKNYWYHWYMALDFGAALVQKERKAFARFLWDTWSPGWRIGDDDFEATAKSFDNPDWADVVVHSYRHRWGLAPGAPDYESLEMALSPAPHIFVPALVIHGGADACNDPSTSEGRDNYFKVRYERVVLDGIGHFPQREAAGEVAGALTRFLSASG